MTLMVELSKKTIKKEVKNDYTKFKLRKCRSLHDCAICGNRIKYNDYYYDGGYGKRVHKCCVKKEKSNDNNDRIE